MPRFRSGHAWMRGLRSLGPTLSGTLVALAWTASAVAQGPAAKKKDEGAWAAFLLMPVAILVCATLQMAVMAAFPRFARRCAAAVSRYRWQTPLAGLAALLATALLAALANQAAGGNQQAGFVVLAPSVLVSTIGGVGVALIAGRWALARIQADAPAHPLLAVLAGASLLGWTMILVPCVGQVLWLLVACASMGAFVLAVLLGRRLDEARSWSDAPSPQPSPPSEAETPPTPAEPRAPQPTLPVEPDRPSGGQMF